MRKTEPEILREKNPKILRETDPESIFAKDVKVPEVVQKKAMAALSEIQTEGTAMKKQYFFGKKAAVAAGVCALFACSLTAAAAYRIWSGRMQGTIEATPEQQQELVENGMATVFEQEPEHADMGVTKEGVTVRPEGVIADGHFVLLAFSVEGYMPGEGEEPCFDRVTVSAGNDEQNAVNFSGSFFNGYVTGSDGKPVRRDGSPVTVDETGGIICDYTDENGRLEFDLLLYPARWENSLLGETIHVAFHDLGTTYHADFAGDIAADWEFDVPISGNSDAKAYVPQAPLGDSGVILKSVELSPISVRLDYVFTDAPAENTDDLPYCIGVRMKDGTLLRYVMDGGPSRVDEEGNGTCLQSFCQVIDADQVDALLFLKGEGPAEGDNLEIVPLGN